MMICEKPWERISFATRAAIDVDRGPCREGDPLPGLLADHHSVHAADVGSPAVGIARPARARRAPAQPGRPNHSRDARASPPLESAARSGAGRCPHAPAAPRHAALVRRPLRHDGVATAAGWNIADRSAGCASRRTERPTAAATVRPRWTSRGSVSTLAVRKSFEVVVAAFEG